MVDTQKTTTKRSRALMEDYSINQIHQGLVICYTPERLNNRPFVTKDGRPIHIFAFFNSYIEFCNYSRSFDPVERCFYEVVFGELPQKPHFDIDIDRTEFATLYPDQNVDKVAPQLLEQVINGIINIIGSIDIERDLLIYSSTGPQKYSYHVVIDNKCHENNKEAKAFYDLVLEQVRVMTNGQYLNFIDPSVYSPRQQFRIVGCQKWGSGRPKLFNEHFTLNGRSYIHRYTENVSDDSIKELTILYESLVGFIPNCSYLPSYIPPKTYSYTTESLTDLDDETVSYCMRILQEQMKHCPFTVRGVQGNRIDLKREAPSPCPICTFTVHGELRHKVHEHEHPYMFIKNGKIYWDCRRSSTGSKFLLGYRAFTLAELQENPSTCYDEDLGGTFTFGDHDIVVSKEPLSPNQINQTTGSNNLIIPPVERRIQNVLDQVTCVSKNKELKTQYREEVHNLDPIRGKISFDDLSKLEVIPNSGMKIVSNGTNISIFDL